MTGVASRDMVRLEACAKRYGPTQALAPTDLVIGEGEFVTLLGPSGSGKTTILNLIAGTTVPTSGRVWIAGRDVTDVPVEKRGLGMVFQNYALMPHMSVFENVAFPLRVRRCPESEIRRKVTEVLNIVRLPGIADRKPRQLSGGQQQRVSLARCIVYNPPLILMDEPLGALDKKLREQLQLEIRSLHRTLGITMLYVTHDQQEALTMSDRIVLLNGGQIEQTGNPDEIYFRPKSVFSADFLGDSSLIAATVEASGPVTSLVTDGGLRFAGEQSEVPPGTRVTAMVRPENVRLCAKDDGDRGENFVDGTVIDTTVLGSVIRHHVRLSDGHTIVANEFNRRIKSDVAPGDTVHVTWHAVDLRVLTA